MSLTCKTRVIEERDILIRQCGFDENPVSSQFAWKMIKQLEADISDGSPIAVIFMDELSALPIIEVIDDFSLDRQGTRVFYIFPDTETPDGKVDIWKSFERMSPLFYILLDATGRYDSPLSAGDFVHKEVSGRYGALWRYTGDLSKSHNHEKLKLFDSLAFLAAEHKFMDTLTGNVRDPFSLGLTYAGDYNGGKINSPTMWKAAKGVFANLTLGKLPFSIPDDRISTMTSYSSGELTSILNALEREEAGCWQLWATHLSDEDVRYIEHIKAETTRLQQIKALWQERVEMSRLPLHFFPSSSWSEEDPDGEANETVLEIGRVLGIDTALDAMIKGVPMSDIIA